MMNEDDVLAGPGSNDVTVDAKTPGSGPDRAQQVCLVEGSGPELSGETRALLRSRLRMASLILSMGFGVFLLWRLAALVFDIQTAAMRTDTPILIGHALVTALLGGFAFSLCRSCPMTGRTLRMKELLVFGIPACYFLVSQHGQMIDCAAKEDYIPNPVAAWLMLIFTYAMFIPNNWRRAVVPIGIFCAAPVAILGVVRATSPEFSRPHHFLPYRLLPSG